MSNGNFQEAYGHFLWALERQPENLEIVSLLLENAAMAGNDYARALWSHDWMTLSSNLRGKAKPRAAIESYWLPDDPHPRAIAEARAEAVRYATLRGVRSGRAAWQFACQWIGSRAIR